MSVCVDDFLLALRTMSDLNSLKRLLLMEYDVKDLSETKTNISWQITRDSVTQIMKLDQSTFIRNLVIEENLSDYNANVISMKAGSVINMSEANDYKEENLHMYQRLIGKLIYLACGTRPDIAFAVGQLSKHNTDPRKSHLRAAKRVMQYLKGIINLRLVYGQYVVSKSPTDPPPYSLISYVDNNFASDHKDWNLVMRYCFFLNEAVMS